MLVYTDAVTAQLTLEADFRTPALSSLSTTHTASSTVQDQQHKAEFQNISFQLPGTNKNNNSKTIHTAPQDIVR